MIMWICGDGPALFGCARCGNCLEHCRCEPGHEVPVHILTKSAQLTLARKHKEQRQTPDREDPDNYELGAKPEGL